MSATERRISNILVLLFIICMAVNTLAFMRLEQSSDSRDTARLQQWSQSHEQLDNERYAVIGTLQKTATENQQKIARLEERLDNLVYWLRATFAALLLELAATVIRLIGWGVQKGARR